MNKLWIKKIWLCLLFSLLLCFLLAWCGDNWNRKSNFSIDVSGFELNYGWNVKLSKVALKTDDLDDIIDLYQEEWDDVWYKDSLLIAQKYSQLGVNAFVQENLDAFEEYDLVLSNINKKQILFEKDWEDVNAVLLEYEIIEWFVEEIPKLYVSQFFIPDWKIIVLMSYITEDPSSRNSMSNAFKMMK